MTKFMKLHEKVIPYKRSQGCHPFGNCDTDDYCVLPRLPRLKHCLKKCQAAGCHLCLQLQALVQFMKHAKEKSLKLKQNQKPSTKQWGFSPLSSKELNQDRRFCTICQDDALKVVKVQNMQPGQCGVFGPHPAILDQGALY